MSPENLLANATLPVRLPARLRECAAKQRVFCFSLHAEAEPGVMPRVLELFAKRNLVPSRWHSDVTGSHNRDLSIDIQVAGLTPELTAYIARCLRQIYGVTAVLTSEKSPEK